MTADEGPPNKVAVKVLKEEVSNEVKKDFEREVEIMSSFDHDNILKLLGIVIHGKSINMIHKAIYIYIYIYILLVLLLLLLLLLLYMKVAVYVSFRCIF